MNTWREQEVAEFYVEVSSKRTVGEVGAEYERTGSGKDWQQCMRLSFEGFNNSRILSLDDIWRDLIENKKTKFTGEVLALETIVKFGDTMQLETPYKVQIKVTH